MKKAADKFVNLHDQTNMRSLLLVKNCEDLLTPEALEPKNEKQTAKALSGIFSKKEYKEVAHLNIDLSDLSEGYCKSFLNMVFSTIKELGNINSITITGLNMSDSISKIVANKLKKCIFVEALTFHHCKISNGAHGHLSQTLFANNKNIIAVSFEDTKIDDNLETVLIGLDQLPNLQHLNFYKCRLKDAQMRKLLKSLSKHQSLRTLNIAGNKITKLKTRKQLGETLKSLPALTEVVLPSYDDDYAFDENIIEVIYLHNKALSVVYISDEFKFKHEKSVLYTQYSKQNTSYIPYQYLNRLHKFPFIYGEKDGRSFFNNLEGQSETRTFFSEAFLKVTENLKKESLHTTPSEEDKNTAKKAFNEAFAKETESKIHAPLRKTDNTVTKAIYENILRVYHRFNGKVDGAKLTLLTRYVNKHRNTFSNLKEAIPDRQSMPGMSFETTDSDANSGEEDKQTKAERFNEKVGQKKPSEFFEEVPEDDQTKNPNKRKKPGLDREEKQRRLKTVNRGMTESQEELLDKYFTNN